MSLPPATAQAIAPLPDGYADVLGRVVAALDADRRVVALWLGGSLGRGVADAGSELDLIVTVADHEADDVIAAGAATWAFLEPVVIREIPGTPGCFALTTAEGLRVDIVLEWELDVAETPYRHRVPVFDRRRTPTPVPVADEERRTPDVATMEAIASEFARQLAIFPDAVVARGDWLLGQEAVHNYRTFLYQLYVETNQPLLPMGVKQWSAKLTAAQRDTLAALPLPAAERAAVIDAMQQVAKVLQAEGRELVERAGGVWPQAAVDAGLARWRASGLV